MAGFIPNLDWLRRVLYDLLDRSPVQVVICCVAYVLLHAYLRLAFSNGLEVDFVEQAYYSQSLALSYGPRQPPLYTWLLIAIEHLVGLSRANFVLLKYAFVGVTMVAYWAFARRVGCSRVAATGALLSLLMLYQFGWKVHHGMTHTAMLMAAVASTALALSAVVARPNRWRLAALGFAIGVGLMSKHGFLVFLVAFVVAAWSCFPGRRLGSARAAIPLGVAAIIYAPFVVSLVTADTSFLSAQLRPASEPATTPWLSALAALAVASAGFLSPMLLVLLVAFPRAFSPAAAVTLGGNDWLRCLDRFHLGMALVLAVAVAVTGVTGFKERWMHAFLLLVPIWLWLRIEAAGYLRRDSWRAPGVVAVAAFLVLLVFGWRIAEDSYGPPFCDRCRALVPYGELAAAIRSDGFAQGLVITTDEHLAGNLRLQFADSVVLAPVYAHYDPPSAPGGATVLVWPARLGEEVPASLLQLAQRRGKAPQGLPPAAALDIPLRVWRTRYPRWREVEQQEKSMEKQAFAWRYLVLN